MLAVKVNKTVQGRGCVAEPEYTEYTPEEILQRDTIPAAKQQTVSCVQEQSIRHIPTRTTKAAMGHTKPKSIHCHQYIRLHQLLL